MRQLRAFLTRASPSARGPESSPCNSRIARDHWPPILQDFGSPPLLGAFDPPRPERLGLRISPEGRRPPGGARNGSPARRYPAALAEERG
eukprot:3729356-Pyramimonas_sp.AAC.1